MLVKGLTLDQVNHNHFSTYFMLESITSMFSCKSREYLSSIQGTYSPISLSLVSQPEANFVE